MADPPPPKHKPEGHFKLNRMHNPPKPRPPWPRPGSRDRYRVIGGQDWAMVANAWGVTDVWDLISWNFGTPGHQKPTPRQVNWYMHHYIGCWRATTDGKNFTFDQADPGYLYIPPVGWTRGMPGLPFHTRVAQALSGLVARYPHFTFAPYSLRPLDLHHVRGALNDGRLSARVDSGLKNEVAVYDSGMDEFVFRNDSTASFDARITIAHEATHAALDRKYAGLDLWRWEYEMIAYTAEALWARATDDAEAEAMLGRGDVPGPTKAALILARYMRAGASVGPMRMKDFDTTLPDYRNAGRRLNPFRDLKAAVWTNLMAIGRDPKDLMLLDGWK